MKSSNFSTKASFAKASLLLFCSHCLAVHAAGETGNGSGFENLTERQQSCLSAQICQSRDPVLSCLAEDKTYTLAQCEALSIAHSDALSIQALEILIDGDKIFEYKAKLYPKISLEGNTTSRDCPPATVSKQEVPVDVAEGEEPQTRTKRVVTRGGDKNRRGGKAVLVIPITDCGFTHFRVKAERKTLESNQYHRDRMVQDLILDVRITYYDILQAIQLLGVVKDSMRQLEQQQASARDLYEAGLTTKNDVLVVEVQYAERKQQYFELTRSLESKMAHLNRLMGKNVNEQFAVSDVSKEVSWSQNLDTITQHALVSHPDLKDIFAQEEAAQYTVKSTRCANLPQISLEGSYNYESERALHHNNWLQGGLVFSMPLFDGGVNYSQIQQTKKQFSQTNYRYSAKVKDIVQDIKSAFLSVDSSFSKLPVAKQSITVAEENLRIMTDLFQEGLVTMNDVMDDETRLSQARANYYQALYEFYNALTALDYASGQLKQKGSV